MNKKHKPSPLFTSTRRPRNLRTQNLQTPARSMKIINSPRLPASLRVRKPFALNTQSRQQRLHDPIHKRPHKPRRVVLLVVAHAQRQPPLPRPDVKLRLPRQHHPAKPEASHLDRTVAVPVPAVAQVARQDPEVVQDRLGRLRRPAREGLLQHRGELFRVGPQQGVQRGVDERVLELGVEALQRGGVVVEGGGRECQGEDARHDGDGVRRRVAVRGGELGAVVEGAPRRVPFARRRVRAQCLQRDYHGRVHGRRDGQVVRFARVEHGGGQGR